MVDFELTDEQKLLRETLAAFSSEKVRPVARPADEEGTFPTSIAAIGAELGLVRGPIPEEFGGYGSERSALSGAIVAEEMAFGDLAIAIHLLTPRLLAFPVLEMGTPAQRKAWLPKFADANAVVGTAAVLEPRFDFDLQTIATTWRKDGAGYLLNGVKCLVPRASEAEAVLIYAAAEHRRGAAEVEGFLVERQTQGLNISEREKNMGLKGIATFEVTLNECRVSSDARLGEERGLNFARLMSQCRVALCAMAVGVARAAYEYAREYAKERKTFGAAIASRQAIAFMLADMAIEVDASRLLVWEAASRLDKSEDGAKESYLAKNYIAGAALKVTDNAVQVLGGHGYIREHPVEMWLRNARGFSAFEGLATV